MSSCNQWIKQKNKQTDEFTHISNTCITLRDKASTFLPTRRQQLLVQKRILQSTIPAANLPNELLHEIFTYLTPKDFYTATKVCNSWRYAGVYPPLIKKHISTLLPRRIVRRTSDPPNYDLRALVSHINKDLGKGILPKYLVSTIQLKQPNSKIPPEIYLSESGHYFLSAERAPPYHVRIYCTYRPVLANDFEAPQLGSPIKNSVPRSSGVSEHSPWPWPWEPGSGALGFHEWDSTPTCMVTLPGPCFRKVIDASFSPLLCGGYTKGVDVIVLFEGGKAKLLKIRPMPRGHSPSRIKKLFKRKTFRQVPRWHIYYSLGFFGHWISVS